MIFVRTISAHLRRVGHRFLGRLDQRPDTIHHFMCREELLEMGMDLGMAGAGHIRAAVALDELLFSEG